MKRAFFIVVGLSILLSEAVEISLVSSFASDYSVKVENTVATMCLTLGTRDLDLNVWYVFPDTIQNPGTVGQFKECLRRLVIQNYFPEGFCEYVVSRFSHIGDTLWEKDAVVAGIPVDSVKVLMRNSQKIYDDNREVIDSLGTQSPRLFINGRELADWMGDYATLKTIIKRILEGVDTISSPEYICYSDLDCFTPVETLRGRCSYRPKGGVCVYDYAFPVVLYVLHSSNPYEPVPFRFYSDLKFWFPRIKFVDVMPNTSLFKELFNYVPASFNTLPMYVMTGNVEKDASFPQIAHMVVRSDTFFVFNPIIISEYVENIEEPGRVDVFVAPMCPYSLQFENMFFDNFLKDGKFVGNDSMKVINFHYVVRKDEKGYYMIHGPEEVDELRRQVVIRDFFPGSFLNYLACRAKNINAGWHICALEADVDTAKLMELVNTKSDSLLDEEIALMNEYGISSTPTFIYKNKYRFNSLRDFARMIGWNLIGQFEDGQCYY